MKKFIGGVAVGAGVATVFAYFGYKHILAQKIKEREAIIKALKERIKTLTDEKTSEAKNADERYQTLLNAYENICTFNNKITQAFTLILNPDMIADIASISDVDLRDECLSHIEETVEFISTLIVHKNEKMTKDELNEIIEKVTVKINKMTDDIRQCIDDDEDDDDEPDEEIMGMVSPKKLILKGINCEDKVFEVDPDIGFEVINGSDTENNDYCIYAQNDSNLYKFLRDSIREQLSNHYVSKIDPIIFEDMTEELMITVSFSFINDTDAEITEVASVIPFEIFNDDKHKYVVKDGEIPNDKLIQLDGDSSDSSESDDREKITPDDGETEKEEKVVTTIDDPMWYVINTIGYNRDSLAHFIGCLDILRKANPEAGASVSDTFVSIINEIQKCENANEMTDAKKSEFCAQIKALARNMKQNYKSDINSYSQSH
jgi:hypothetical protein